MEAIQDQRVYTNSGQMDGIRLSRAGRIHLIDELRGFAIIVMLVYHFLYSLMFVFGIGLAPWVLPTMLYLQPFGAALFIVIAGISSCLARSNRKRGLQILFVALGISLATSLLMPSQAIYFGVLHFYAAAIFIFVAGRRLFERLSPVALAIGSGIVFYVTRPLAEGYLMLPVLGRLALPESLYSAPLLAPLGLPPSSFVSADYFPLLPWFPVFLIGTAIGRLARTRGLPPFCYRSHAPALSRIGRHSLPIYILHQPAILAILWLATRLA